MSYVIVQSHIQFCMFASAELSGLRDRRAGELKVSDVQSLYPNKGISDAVIDFYIKYI